MPCILNVADVVARQVRGGPKARRCTLRGFLTSRLQDLCGAAAHARAVGLRRRSAKGIARIHAADAARDVDEVELTQPGHGELFGVGLALQELVAPGYRLGEFDELQSVCCEWPF
jgi:hypothetical protein